MGGSAECEREENDEQDEHHDQSGRKLWARAGELAPALSVARRVARTAVHVVRLRTHGLLQCAEPCGTDVLRQSPGTRVVATGALRTWAERSLLPDAAVAHQELPHLRRVDRPERHPRLPGPPPRQDRLRALLRRRDPGDSPALLLHEQDVRRRAGRLRRARWAHPVGAAAPGGRRPRSRRQARVRGHHDRAPLCG